MKNYNYYDKLKKFNNEKKYNMGVFDKPQNNGYNKNAEIKMQNAKWDKPLYDYRPNYGHSERNEVETKNPEIPRQARNDTDKIPRQVERSRTVPYGNYNAWQNNAFPYTSSYGKANVGATHESPVYNSSFKKNAENQWYNKITHGSFKEDDWFNSMVKNQEKAQNWYNTTYGEKNGRKEYQNLHNRLINTPYNKIKEEEKQFINYKASDFKVPEMKPVNYSYNQYDTKNKDSKKVTENTGNRKQATNIIRQNANDIRDAAYRYGVDPVIVAACIYGEQAMNYDMIDKFTDKIYVLNTSIGVGQVRVSTAKELEDLGYVEPVTYVGDVVEWHGNGTVKKQKWNIPGYGVVIVNNREHAIAKRLEIDSECINYVAAYVASLQKAWEWAYPDIYRDTAITATLYNQGVGNPKANPEPNEFGKFIRNNYDYINEIFNKYLN